jgi:cis-3-alkyl-4-acyloxetan-2-one decarboxylase
MKQSRSSPQIDITPFRHLYPFTAQFADVNGFSMHYVDEGRGEPVVMVHGNPTWSFFYRELIKGLMTRHRCIAPDHIGCGLSARPSASEYSFRLYDRVADFCTFIEALDLKEKMTLVVHDWGGMIGAAFAVRYPERIARLVVMNTAAFLKPKRKSLPWILKLIRSFPSVAVPAVLGLNLFARGAVWTASAKPLRPEVCAGLLAPYNSWHNRLATLKFVQDIPLSPADPSYAIAAEVDAGLQRLAEKPMLLCWGTRDFVFDSDYLAEWQRRFPKAEVHRFPEAGHYLLEDAAERLLPLVKDFLRRHPGQN